ncbi:MAG: DnaA regulatory inactivator Hda [Halioglobus sp.]|nr:DnaA regulatory inactivator Hda [Halioglobus sp.]
MRLRDDATYDNLHPIKAIQPALAALRDIAQPAAEKLLYLHGPAGAGKSHLLQAACHAAGVDALYLPLAELAAYPAEEVLAGASALQLLCVDDLQAVAGRPDWEQALFNSYNLGQQAGSAMLFTATLPPRDLGVALPDLESRLAASVVFQLPEPDDDEKAQILRFRARRRGLGLSDETTRFIVTRAPRDLEALLGILERLDEASLEQQRALSTPFVKHVLGW